MVIQYKKAGKSEEWKFTSGEKDMIKIWNKYINESIKEMKDEKLNPPRDIVVDNKEPETNKEPTKNDTPLAQNTGKDKDKDKGKEPEPVKKTEEGQTKNPL